MLEPDMFSNPDSRCLERYGSLEAFLKNSCLAPSDNTKSFSQSLLSYPVRTEFNQRNIWHQNQSPSQSAQSWLSASSAIVEALSPDDTKILEIKYIRLLKLYTQLRVKNEQTSRNYLQMHQSLLSTIDRLTNEKTVVEKENSKLRDLNNKIKLLSGKPNTQGCVEVLESVSGSILQSHGTDGVVMTQMPIAQTKFAEKPNTENFRESLAFAHKGYDVLAGQLNPNLQNQTKQVISSEEPVFNQKNYEQIRRLTHHTELLQGGFTGTGLVKNTTNDGELHNFSGFFPGLSQSSPLQQFIPLDGRYYQKQDPVVVQKQTLRQKSVSSIVKKSVEERRPVRIKPKRKSSFQEHRRQKSQIVKPARTPPSGINPQAISFKSLAAQRSALMPGVPVTQQSESNDYSVSDKSEFFKVRKQKVSRTGEETNPNLSRSQFDPMSKVLKIKNTKESRNKFTDERENSLKRVMYWNSASKLERANPMALRRSVSDLKPIIKSQEKKNMTQTQLAGIQRDPDAQNEVLAPLRLSRKKPSVLKTVFKFVWRQHIYKLVQKEEEFAEIRQDILRASNKESIFQHLFLRGFLCLILMLFVYSIRK